jgi:hypothetical protein
MVLLLPTGLAAGNYTVRLFYGKHASGVLEFGVVVTNLAVSPGSVIGASLDSALKTDLDDAATFGGHDAAYFLDASHLTGTVDVARFSAYADLLTESKVGVLATQVAAGDHTHDGRYLLKAGDSATGANFTFSATTGTALSGTAAAAGSYGLAATNTASNGVALNGTATNVSGTSTGLEGVTSAPAGFGVHGDNQSQSGTAVGVYGTTASTAGSAVLGVVTVTGGNANAVEGQCASSIGAGVKGSSSSASGVGVRGDAASTSGAPIGVYASAQSAAGAALFAQSQGIGVQVSAQGTGLLVSSAANFAIFQSGAPAVNKARIDSTGKGFFNGGTQTSGADFAESVETARPAKDYEPGDVIVIDATGTRRFALASGPNSKLVAGVYATKPGVLARNGDVAAEGAKWTETEIPMAIVGIVPTKVCDEGGAIAPGDLLVTSSTPGHAMKAPASPASGTVLGKALGRMDAKTGRVEVLLIAR